MTVRIARLYIHARYKIESGPFSLSLATMSHHAEPLANHFCPSFAADIRGTLTKWRRKVGRMRRGVRLTRRRCAEKKNGSRSGTKWSIHFFQLSRVYGGQLRGRAEGRRRGESKKTDERRKDIRHLCGKTVWSEWYLNHCLSVKRAGIVSR